MRILHRYILGEMLGPFVGGVLVFTFLLLVTQLFRLADLLINRGISIELVGNTLLCLLPQILALTAPMGLLLAALLAFGRLSADREIIAIRASGISLWTLYLPAIVAGAILTGAMYPFLVNVVPNNRERLTRLKGDMLFALTSALEPRIVYNPDTIDATEIVHLFYQERGAQKNEMSRVQMHIVTGAGSQPGEGGRNEAIILAREGRLTAYPQAAMIELKLRDGAIHVFDKYAPESYSVVRFNELAKGFILDVDRIDKRGLRPEEMRLDALRLEIARLAPMQPQGKPATDQEERLVERYRNCSVEYWTRLSMPLSCLAFALIGMPLGVMGRTSARASGFGVAFLLFFLYYILLQWGASLGQDGHPLAMAAIFSPNIVLGSLGLFLIFRTARQ
jgi:lipopolysaccharide export system permease protein